MLVADFAAAERCLKRALAEMKVFGIFNFLRPTFVHTSPGKNRRRFTGNGKGNPGGGGAWRGVGAKKGRIIIDGKSVRI
jgi:hypothetical protein